MQRGIAVVEPQMEAMFHAPFNAALLHAVALAYPGVAVSFRGFPDHLRIVRGILEQQAPEAAQRIEWRVTPLAGAGSLIARWRQAGRVMREVLRAKERVVFCSISRMQLLVLKRAMRDGDDVRAVLHGDLDQIAQPPRERFPMSLMSLHRVLLQKNAGTLRYVLLSESIRAHVPQAFAAAFANAGVIDHPYHFFPLQEASHALPKPMVLGMFGNTGDGRLLEQVARAVKAANPEVRFRLVGFLADDAAVERLQPFVEDVGAVPISREVFLERAEGVTHTLWLATTDSFQLRASGTFFDALAYAKPLVYTANPFIDPYYAMEPGIGVRCETMGDVPGSILELAACSTVEEYAAARAAMLRLRKRFTPHALAERLPASLGWS